MNTRILSTTEARKKIFSLTEKVQMGGMHYTLTENGRAKAVIMSSDEYESWKETLELMSDVPDIPARIARAERDIARGKTATLHQLLKTYAIQRAPRSRGRKKSR
jgi:prevent-host-death family protein